MKDESIPESLRAWLLLCPALGGGVFSMDRVETRPASCTLRPKGETVLRRYLDGGQQKELRFEICICGFYGADTEHLLRMRRRLDTLVSWLLFQRRCPPALSGGRRALLVEPLEEAAFTKNGENSALWVLPCRLVYFQPPPSPLKNCERMCPFETD